MHDPTRKTKRMHDPIEAMVGVDKICARQLNPFHFVERERDSHLIILA